jgi:SAM-dependent methyltransferase
MRRSDAIDLLAPGLAGLRGPASWADLGCGRGTFTMALAHLLAPGSTIHAVDQDPASLSGLPGRHGEVRIRTWCADFVEEPWPFGGLDGILMANSLHYVRDQASFLRQTALRVNPEHRFLIVEYDTDAPNRWVPYPVSARTLGPLFAGAGYSSVEVLGRRRSIYHRSPLYAALITP